MAELVARGLVLDRGPSDHSPFVKPLWYTNRPEAPPVRVVFWNANHGTNDTRARPTFRRLVDDYGVHLLILNEIKQRSGIVDMLRDDFGLGVRWTAPEFAVAWSRDRFDFIRDRPLVMSEHDYWLERNEALAVVLHDTVADIDLKAISQHPPAHIARRRHKTFPNVLAVHKDVAARNARIMRNSQMPTVIGRDSNIDPRKDRPVLGRDWAWAYRGPLGYVRAPAPTHGGRQHGRHIDELLINDGLQAAPPQGGTR